MSDLGHIVRNIETLRTSLRIDHAELEAELDSSEREALMRHIAWCLEELRRLQNQLAGRAVIGLA
jgi:hypothetical protein